MKRYIAIAIILLGTGLLLAQTTTPNPTAPPSGFENVRRLTGDTFTVEIKALIPDITTFKNKAETYNKEGYYNFPKDFLGLVQKLSKEQITNWQVIWLEQAGAEHRGAERSQTGK